MAYCRILSLGIRDIDAWSPRMRETFLEIYDEEYFRKLCNDWADAYNSYADFNNGKHTKPLSGQPKENSVKGSFSFHLLYLKCVTYI